ncbi:MAG: SurA N-terminal domain-containing protein [Candidatus Promineifilaceae bacterium]
MAKKSSPNNEGNQRQSRKEVLIARKHEQQMRRVWIAVIAVIALIVLVFVFGIVNELIIKPARPVAIVNGSEISLADWRDQVQYSRALLVSRIEQIADLVEGDVEQLQQIAGQELQAISDPETFGQQVLEEMIDSELILQEAEARGIHVSDADLEKEIEGRFLYFDGESPTPRPSPTGTPMPTPSLTPIIGETITDSVELESPTPTTGPTSTPQPTPTPVSLEAFEQSLGEWYDLLNSYGVDEEMFRRDVRLDMYRQLLLESLANTQEVSDEAEKVSFFYIRFDNREDADAASSEIDASDYLTVWNTVRSQPADNTENTAFAGELLWRTADNIESILGPDVREAVFESEVNTPSDVIIIPSTTEDGIEYYYIVMPSGREVRPLSETELDTAKQEVFDNWINAARLQDVVTFERWRANIPSRPLLDTSGWIYPTAVPTAALGDPALVTPVPTAQ